MTITEIEFVAGYCLGKWMGQQNIDISSLRETSFEEDIKEWVLAALEYLDNPEEFEKDVAKEIKEILGEDV